MAASTLYVCDGCGAHKGTANHWYVLHLQVNTIQIYQWFGNAITTPGALHYCGEACLLKKISERLGRSSFAADAPPVVIEQTLEDDDEPVVTLRDRIDELDSRDLEWGLG